MQRILLCSLLSATACQKPAAPAQVTPRPMPAPAVDAAVVPSPDPAPPAKRCVEFEAWQERDACLAALPPSSSFEAVSESGEPFGYICSFFGGVGGKPRCSESGNVRVLARWIDPAAPCPFTLSLYFAPMQPPSGPGSALGEGAPGQPLEPLLWPSDGSVFGYLRLDNFVLEADTCEGREATVTDALEKWGQALQPQVFE